LRIGALLAAAIDHIDRRTEPTVVDRWPASGIAPINRASRRNKPLNNLLKIHHPAAGIRSICVRVAELRASFEKVLDRSQEQFRHASNSWPLRAGAGAIAPSDLNPAYRVGNASAPRRSDFGGRFQLTVILA
jgi:hypothetical protein